MSMRNLLALCFVLGCSDSAKPPQPSQPAAVSGNTSAIIYKALGNEPFWHVDVRTNDLQLFEMADLRVTAPKYTVEERAQGREYKSAELTLSIDFKECSDGMSDRKYPHTAHVRYEKGSFHGCGWPAGYDLGPPP